VRELGVSPFAWRSHYLLALACEISRRTNGSKSHRQSVRPCMFRGQTWGYLMGGSQLLPLQPTSGRPSCRGELVRYVPRSQRFDRGPWATSHSASNSSAIRSSQFLVLFPLLTEIPNHYLQGASGDADLCRHSPRVLSRELPTP
jgi:hypothetical protein